MGGRHQCRKSPGSRVLPQRASAQRYGSGSPAAEGDAAGADEAHRRRLRTTPNLYSLRALEDEQQLDFTAAEADWKKYTEVASDKGAARLALADFYHRRLRSRDEFNALVAASFEPAPASEKLFPPSAQRPWKTFERSINLVDEARLDPLLAVGQYTPVDRPLSFRDQSLSWFFRVRDGARIV